jgi:hypothetical protein
MFDFKPDFLFFQFYDNVLAHEAMGDLVYCMINECCDNYVPPMTSSVGSCLKTKGPLGEFIVNFPDHPMLTDDGITIAAQE